MPRPGLPLITVLIAQVPSHSLSVNLTNLSQEVFKMLAYFGPAKHGYIKSLYFLLVSKHNVFLQCYVVSI